MQVSCTPYIASDTYAYAQGLTASSASCDISLGDQVKQMVQTLGDTVLQCSLHKPRSVLHSVGGQEQCAVVVLLPLMAMFYNDKI